MQPVRPSFHQGFPENTIHIKIEIGNATSNGINPQRVKCRIYFNRTIQFVKIFLYNLIKLKAYILTFQFIPMGTCHDTDTLLARTMANNIFCINKRSSTGSAIEITVLIIFLLL